MKNIHGRRAFILEDPPDAIIEVFKFCWYWRLSEYTSILNLGSNLSIASTEDERAASRIIQLQTPYGSTMGDKRESDLNFIASTANIKNWHTKCRPDVDQKLFPKNV